MKILLTGATGLIGRELGKVLALRGDSLVCLVRNASPEGPGLPFPATCFEWDHTREVPAEALAGVDAVVHLAGEPIADGRWTPERKARIVDSRILGTRRLVEAVRAHGDTVGAFVHGSAIGYWGDRGDEVLTADSMKGGGFLSDLVADWEAELAPLLDTHQRPRRVPIVRTGVVLARQSGALAKMLPIFRAGVGGRIGAGSHWMSWIHLDDIVGLFMHALDTPADGILEGVAPGPVTNRDFTRELARALDVFENAPAPELAIRLLYGEMGTVVLESARVEPARTLQTGYRFRFETVGSALDDLLTPLRGGTWLKTWEQWVPRTPEEIWPFFADPHNLEAITPAFLNFEVLGASTPEIGEGTLIDYRLKLDGLPLKWQSRIESWEPVRSFVDTQVTGPYALWHHTHEFVPLAGGTLMRDVVRYKLPLGWLGATVGGCHVESKVGRIFAFRTREIARRFGA